MQTRQQREQRFVHREVEKGEQQVWPTGISSESLFSEVSHPFLSNVLYEHALLNQSLSQTSNNVHTKGHNLIHGIFMDKCSCPQS